MQAAKNQSFVLKNILKSLLESSAVLVGGYLSFRGTQCITSCGSRRPTQSDELLHNVQHFWLLLKVVSP